MIYLVFVCRGRMLKNFGKVCKINSFIARKGTYYTIWKENCCHILYL